MSDGTSRVPLRVRWSTLGTLLLFASTTVALAYFGYITVFAHFAALDDEGSHLIQLQGFHFMGKLYRDVYATYGPLYYELMDGVFSLFRLPFAHDHGRLVTLVIYVAASLICGVVMLAVSGNTLLGCCTQLLVFKSLLESLTWEPMHPGGLASLLLACLAGTVLLLGSYPRATLALQGALVGSLLFIKINVGVLALLSLGVFWATTLRTSRPRSLLLAACALVAAAPVFLMMSNLDADLVQRFFLLVTASTAAVMLALMTADSDESLPPRTLAWFIAAAGAVALLSTVILIMRGSSVRDLVEGTLIHPLQWTKRFYLPLILGPHNRAIAVLSFLLCLAAIHWRRRGGEAGNLVNAVSASVRIATGALITYNAAGLFQRWIYEFHFVPLAWVAVMRPTGTRDSLAMGRFRRFVPLLAVLQTLQAYPIAGAPHVSTGSFLFIPVAALCVLDGSRQLGLVAGRKSAAHAKWMRYALSGALIAAVIAGGFFIPLRQAHAVYTERVPLSLRGSSRIRLSPEEVSTFTWLTTNIEQRCTAFVALPALNSLYLWTGQAPPTGFNTGPWWFYLTAAQQSVIVDRIRPIDRLCVIRQNAFVAYWNGLDRFASSQPRPESVHQSPLLDYISRGFVSVESRGGYELMVRSRSTGR